MYHLEYALVRSVFDTFFLSVVEMQKLLLHLDVRIGIYEIMTFL